MTNELKREEVPNDYSKMMNQESHHSHAIIKDSHGIIRWKENPDVRTLLSGISLNKVCLLLNLIGHGKNSEVYRSLYRNLGYSLSGYWEIFYWDFNNEDVDIYTQPPNENKIKRQTILEAIQYLESHQSTSETDSELLNEYANSLEDVMWRENRPPDIGAFIQAIIDVCKQHHLSLGHEDRQGAFIVEDFDENKLRWLQDAQDDTTPN